MRYESVLQIEFSRAEKVLWNACFCYAHRFFMHIETGKCISYKMRFPIFITISSLAKRDARGFIGFGAKRTSTKNV